jgi:hypothetical protein
MDNQAFSEETLIEIQSIMDEKKEEIEKLHKELIALNKARLIYLASIRTHHEFDKKKDLKDAMRRNFNPFDTFSLKKKLT